MKTAIILESDHLGLAVSDLLNPKELKLIGIANSDPDTWNVFSNLETGELKDEIEGLPIMPVDLAVSLQPDVLVIAANDQEKSHAMRYMAIRAGFENDIIFIKEISDELTVKGAVIRKLSRRISQLGLEGAVAELGCYKGDTSWQLNALFPEKKLYLFDTMDGYDSRDIAKEKSLGLDSGKDDYYEKVKEETLLSRMASPENVILKKGWFPETAFDMEDEKFAFVVMDACLYQPSFAGLEYFFPRMNQGGIILINDYDNYKHPGVAKAVLDFEAKYGAFLILPVGDLTGTVMIVHP